MSQLGIAFLSTKPLGKRRFKQSLVAISLLATFSMLTINGHAASVTTIEPTAEQSTTLSDDDSSTTPTSPSPNSETLAAQLQPSASELSVANQKLLSQNAQLQRQVNDLQTQVNVLVYESRGQLFLYGAFTVIISLLVGVFISWLVFVRRERW